MKFLFRAAILCVLCTACTTGWQGEQRDFRQDMRNFVQAISACAKNVDPDFIIIPQNGHELLTTSGGVDGTPAAEYISAVTGIGREDLFYGYDADNKPTPPEDTAAMLGFMDLAEGMGVEVLVTDYCSSETNMADSYQQNNVNHRFISFAADSRDLDTIPAYPPVPYGANSSSITKLSEAKNFLYLLDPSHYSTKADYLGAIDRTNYDVIIMDLFFEDGDGNIVALTPADLAALRTKENNGSRLLICYMSIGEAEDYRFYWQDSWKRNPPEWLAGENSAWKGNFKVEYWNTGWQSIIYGSNSAYLGMIMAAGFDGVYLDLIDAYEYFEDALDL